MSMASVSDAPPVYDGSLEGYKEWRRRAELWTLSTRLESSKHGPKLVSVLSGAAWDALKHLQMSGLSHETGAAKVLETLDEIFGDPKDVLLVEATDEALYLTVKQAAEDVVAFQTRLDAKFRRLESVGGLKIPSEVKGFVLAKEAGLNTMEVRELLTLTGGALHYDQVRTAMRRLLWDFSKPSGPKRGNLQNKNVFLTEETAEWQGTEEDYAEFESLEELLPDETVSEAEAQGIYIAYKEARQRLNQQKLNRGYFQAGRMEKGAGKGKKGGGAADIAAWKAKSRCRRCGEVGHWQRECPKKKAMYAEGNGASASSASGGYALCSAEGQTNVSYPDSTAFFVIDEPECVVDSTSSSGSRCVSMIEHTEGVGTAAGKGLSQASRGICVRGTLSSASMAWHCSEQQPYQMQDCLGACQVPLQFASCCFSNSPSDGPPQHVVALACIDTGCTRTLIGEKTLARLEESLSNAQVRIPRKAGSCTFRFGADFTFDAKEIAMIPCRIGDRLGCISAYLVPGETPLLLSLPLLRTWETVLDLPHRTMQLCRWQCTLPLHFWQGHVQVDLWQDLNGATCQDMQGRLCYVSEECGMYHSVESSLFGRKLPEQKRSCRSELDASSVHGKECSCTRPDGSRVESRSDTRCQTGSGSGSEARSTFGGSVFAADSKAANREQSGQARACDPRCCAGPCESVDQHCRARVPDFAGSVEHPCGAAPRSASGSSIDRAVASAGYSKDPDVGEICGSIHGHSSKRSQLCQVAPGEREQGATPRGIDVAATFAQRVQGDQSCVATHSSSRVRATVSSQCLDSEPIKQEPSVGKKKLRRLEQQRQKVKALWEHTAPLVDVILGDEVSSSVDLDVCLGCQIWSQDSLDAWVTKQASEPARRLLVCSPSDCVAKCKECLTQPELKQWSWIILGLNSNSVSVTASSPYLSRAFQQNMADVACAANPLHYICHVACQVFEMQERVKLSSWGLRLHNQCSWCRSHDLGYDVEEQSLWADVRPSEIVSQVAASLPRLLPLNAHRQSVYDKDRHQIRGVRFGLLVRRGKGISKADRTFAGALSSIHMLARCRPVNHGYVSIQVNMLLPGQSIPVHQDSRNLGDSWVLAFGQYEGGELLVREQNQWKHVHNHLRWIRLPRDVEHKVEPVHSGIRYSLVLYSPRGCEKALAQAPELQDQLRSSGYPIPKMNHSSLVYYTENQRDEECVIICLQPGYQVSVDERLRESWYVLNSSQDDPSMLGKALLSKKKLLLLLEPESPHCVESWLKQLSESQVKVQGLCEECSSEQVRDRLLEQGCSLKCISEKMHVFEEHILPLWYMLRQAGASEYVLQQARGIRCSVCQVSQPPKTPRVTSAPSAAEFNAIVGMDVFHVQGISAGDQVHVLHMLDWSTCYQVCVVLKEVTAKRVRKAYRRYWLRVFGAPGRVITDGGPEFVGAEMSERLETDGTYHEVTAAESPWQNGKTERHGGTMKMLLTKARLTCPPATTDELEELLAECCQAKNRFSLVGGFSPTQRVFGTQLRVPGANFSDELRGQDISIMSALESGDRALQKSFEMRKAAIEAYQFLDSSTRVRKAILSGPRSTQRFFPGDMIYFWRRDADAQAFRLEHRHAHWHGPAVVLGHHRSKVWVSFRGHLWLCSPEQIRPASQEELAAQNVSVSELNLEGPLEVPVRRPDEGSGEAGEEPSTSARPMVAGDVLDSPIEETEIPRLTSVPQTPVGRVPGTPRPRGRSPGGLQGRMLESRSRSRARATSYLFQTLAETSKDSSHGCLDETIQQHVQEFEEFFGVNYASHHQVECLVLMAAGQGLKKRKELSYHLLNRVDQTRFAAAMLKEWRDNILRPEASELLSLGESLEIRLCPERARRIVPTRWVLVDKDLGPKLETSAKARLVVQGYMDPDLGEVELSSPTLHKDSLGLLLQMIASFRWRLVIADIKGAFMSSRPLQRSQGDLFASLPKLWLHPEEAGPSPVVAHKGGVVWT